MLGCYLCMLHNTCLFQGTSVRHNEWHSVGLLSHIRGPQNPTLLGIAPRIPCLNFRRHEPQTLSGHSRESTTTMDRNLRFPGAVSTVFFEFLHWIFCFFSRFYALFSKEITEMWRKWRISGGEKCVESCHVSDCRSRITVFLHKFWWTSNLACRFNIPFPLPLCILRNLLCNTVTVLVITR